MNREPKVQLSPLEMELVINSGWILTKNGIIEKVKVLLTELQARQQALLSGPIAIGFSFALPEEVILPSPKISKGENYKGLPYLVLDYPRYFNKEHILLSVVFSGGEISSAAPFIYPVITRHNMKTGSYRPFRNCRKTAILFV